MVQIKETPRTGAAGRCPPPPHEVLCGLRLGMVQFHGPQVLKMATPAKAHPTSHLRIDDHRRPATGATATDHEADPFWRQGGEWGGIHLKCLGF